MSDDENGSDEEQPKGNIFMQQAAMKSKMNLDDQKKKTCLGCKKDVWPNQEKIMPTKDNFYHAECFKCEVCKSRLQSGKFSALKGHFYCTPHYTELLKAAGGKVDAVVNTDRNKIEQAREAARTTATNKVAGIKAAEDEGRGTNWQAAKGTAKASDAAGRAEVAKQRADDMKANDRAKNATSGSGQAIRAKFAPPKPSFERTSVDGGAAPPAKPAAKAAFKAPAPAPAPAAKASSVAAKFAPPKVAAAPAKPAAKAAAAVPPPGRAASPGGGRGKFAAPAPKFDVDPEEEERRKAEEEERRRREEEEAAARQREEEETRQREEEERRQREEEEARQREEEERQRAEAEASQAQPEYSEEAPPAEEPPAEEYQQQQEDFQPVAGKKWERIEHEDGDVYFYNHETGESLWEQPEDYDG